MHHREKNLKMSVHVLYGILIFLCLYNGLLHGEEQACSAGNKLRILDSECSESDTQCNMERLESRLSVVEALLKEESMKNELIREVLIRRHKLMELLQEDVDKQAGEPEAGESGQNQDKTQGKSN